MVASSTGSFLGGEPQRTGSTENVMAVNQGASVFGNGIKGSSGANSLSRCRASVSSLSGLFSSSSHSPLSPPLTLPSLPSPVVKKVTRRYERKLASSSGSISSPGVAHSPSSDAFHRSFREAMEPQLAKARLKREKARNRTHLQVHAAIASSMGVPYTGVRSERAFLFDSETHPLHTALAHAIGSQDLTQLHHKNCNARTLLEPLVDRESRVAFQTCYDCFVTSFCIPLLHSLAMSKNLFHSTSSDASPNITYRYQAFPTIRIRQPGDKAVEPACDTSNGHSIGCLRFHVPLTPVQGGSALYTESHPGREDFHPLLAKSVGLGYLFDGARCLHFDMDHEETPTAATAVSLDFRIAIYREGEQLELVSGNHLCNKEILEDNFSRAGPGYYDEAVIDIGLGSPSWRIVAKKYGSHLLDPDHRVGAPF